MASEHELEASVTALCRRLYGDSCRLDAFSNLTGGASKKTYAMDAITDHARWPLILQFSQSGAQADPDGDVIPRLPSESDAAIQLLARNNAVPAPEIIHVLTAEDGIGAGYVSKRIEGETLGARIVRGDSCKEARPKLAAQCGRALAAIHAIDPQEAGIFLPRVSAQDLLARFASQVDRTRFHHPALEWALAWLVENLPEAAQASVCHGDFRNGNLIVGPDGLRTVLDWELASLGEPLQDLGWLCVRSWRFGAGPECGGFGSRDDLLQAYRDASGRDVTLRELLYWEAFGNVRWALHCLRRGVRHQMPEHGFSVEDAGIGRRLAEPLYDFFQLVKEYD